MAACFSAINFSVLVFPAISLCSMTLEQSPLATWLHSALSNRLRKERQASVKKHFCSIHFDNLSSSKREFSLISHRSVVPSAAVVERRTAAVLAPILLASHAPAASNKHLHLPNHQLRHEYRETDRLERSSVGSAYRPSCIHWQEAKQGHSRSN